MRYKAGDWTSLTKEQRLLILIGTVIRQQKKRI